MGGNTLDSCYILHIKFNLILSGKIGRDLETNSATFVIVFTKLAIVNSKYCSVPPCFEKLLQILFFPHTYHIIVNNPLNFLPTSSFMC